MRTTHPVLFAGLCLAACNGKNAAADQPSPAQQIATAAEHTEPVKPRPEGEPQPTLPIGTVELIPTPPPPAPQGGYVLKVEVASTPAQQMKGLMFREHLGEDEGMLFVFPDESHRRFWMHNTLIPLDMFFIDSDFNVIGVVENAEPLTDDGREVEGEAQYVLEVPGGFAKRHGFGRGSKVHYTPPKEGT